MKGRRIAFVRKGIAELEEYEIPPLHPDEVLIEMDYSVVSAGTEKACLLDLPNVFHTWPKYLGYSGSGRITAVGAEASDFAVGDRVLADHLGHRSHAVAKFVRNGNGFFKITENVKQLEAAFVVIGSMGVGGVRKLKIQLGESVMVTGLGILGLFAVQAANLSGGLPVVAVDFDGRRCEIAKRLGADYALAPDASFRDTIREITGGRMVNANVEVTGSSRALLQALEVAAWEGRISLTGCTRVSDTPIDYYKLVHRPGVQLIGAHNFVRPREDSYPGYWTRHDDFKTILGFMANGKMTAAPLVSEVVSPEGAKEIYSRLAADELPLGTVFDWHK